MASAIAGAQKGGASAISCIQVAALVTAAIVRANRNALVLPFAETVKEIEINARDSVMSRGFSDDVFEVIERFASGSSCSDHWIGLIENEEL